MIVAIVFMIKSDEVAVKATSRSLKFKVSGAAQLRSKVQMVMDAGGFEPSVPLCDRPVRLQMKSF